MFGSCDKLLNPETFSELSWLIVALMLFGLFHNTQQQTVNATLLKTPYIILIHIILGTAVVTPHIAIPEPELVLVGS